MLLAVTIAAAAAAGVGSAGAGGAGDAARSSSAGGPVAAIASERALGPGTTLMRLRERARGGATKAFVIRVDLRDPTIRVDLLYPGRIAAVQRLSTMARRAG